MTKQLEHEVFFARAEGGAFIASSATSPYFLFEADSEEAVREIACQALNFYFGEEGYLDPVNRPQPAHRTNLTRVFRQKSEILTIGDVAAA